MQRMMVLYPLIEYNDSIHYMISIKKSYFSSDAKDYETQTYQNSIFRGNSNENYQPKYFMTHTCISI